METWMSTFKSKKGITIISLFLLLLLGLFFHGTYAGLFLIFSLLIFGLISSFWKEKNIRILALVCLVLLALINMGMNDLKYGIDFSGGTRIPVILEQPVDQETMNELIDIIKKRSSVLGLSEVKVTSIGNAEINVEVPSGNEDQITFIEEVLSHQGVYEGIVDGKVALTGEDILPGTVQELPPQYLSQGSDWGVSFTITSTSAKNFAEVVKGKQNYPLYMFLYKPKDAIIILSQDELSYNSPEGISVDDLLDTVEDALQLEDEITPIYLLEDLDSNSTLIPKTNYTKALISRNSPEWLVELLESQSFKIDIIEEENLYPLFSFSQSGEPSLVEWQAVGLLSSPRLNPSLADGTISTFYSISGPAQGEGAEKAQNADQNVKRITSVLKGGALPVQISLGSKTVLPPQLGLEFLRLSFIAIVISLILISIFIGLRYLKTKLILPIVIISISELIILISILGSFTIDLAAMAGIIAAIGVGVDAQIVITDELLKKDIEDAEEKLDIAFNIIKVNVVVAIVGMLPLLFSGMVEVIGFAISTILGALLGLLITRPAYAAIVEHIIE